MKKTLSERNAHQWRLDWCYISPRIPSSGVSMSKLDLWYLDLWWEGLHKDDKTTRGIVVRTLEDIFDKLTNDTAWNCPTTQSGHDKGSQMQRTNPATPQYASKINMGPRHITASEGQLLGVHRPAKETTFSIPEGTSSTPLAVRTATYPQPSPKMTEDRDHETTKATSGSHKRNNRSAMPTPNRMPSLSRDGNLHELHLNSKRLPSAHKCTLKTTWRPVFKTGLQDGYEDLKTLTDP